MMLSNFEMKLLTKFATLQENFIFINGVIKVQRKQELELTPADARRQRSSHSSKLLLPH
jgi:hypothetical protein